MYITCTIRMGNSIIRKDLFKIIIMVYSERPKRKIINKFSHLDSIRFVHTVPKP